MARRAARIRRSRAKAFRSSAPRRSASTSSGSASSTADQSSAGGTSRPSSPGSGRGGGPGKPASGSSGQIARAEGPPGALARAGERLRLGGGDPELLPGGVGQAGEAQVVVVAAAEEAAGERAEDPPGAGLLADQAAEVAVEHEGAVGRPEPAGGLEREDVGGNDVRVHGPGSRASLHDEANNRRKPPPLSSPSLAF